MAKNTLRGKLFDVARESQENQRDKSRGGRGKNKSHTRVKAAEDKQTSTNTLEVGISLPHILKKK